MLIAAALALAVVAAPTQAPPIVIHLMVGPNISPALVERIIGENDAVWRGTGITFQWVRMDRAAVARRGPASPFGPPTLRVVVGSNVGRAVRENALALGWIRFENDHPDPEIYLSHENALTLLRDSIGVVGHSATMPMLMRETYLGRAMGRALAHEIGHYLTGSKAHAERGLMKAAHTAFELFGQERTRFGIASAEQQAILARFTSIYIASRH